MAFKDLSSALALGVIIYCLSLCSVTWAQDDTTTTTMSDDDLTTTTMLPAQIESCVASTSMAVDLQKFEGVWWEVARYPALTDLLCVEVNFTVSITSDDYDEVSIATTYSNTPTYPWVNQTMTTKIMVDPYQGNSAGYNISYLNGLTNTSQVVYKLLYTDYSNFSLVCGYSNASDSSTAFGIVLTRLRQPSTSVLDSYIVFGSEYYENFVNNSMNLLTQDDTCDANSAKSLQFSYGAILLIIFHTFLRNLAPYSK